MSELKRLQAKIRELEIRQEELKRQEETLRDIIRELTDKLAHRRQIDHWKDEYGPLIGKDKPSWPPVDPWKPHLENKPIPMPHRTDPFNQQTWCSKETII